MIRSGIRAATALVLVIGTTSAAQAQRILDWPLRTSAGPEAVARGAEGAFWNPAAIFAGPGRGEVLIADQRSPDVIGVGGFAAAGAWRLDARTTIAAGYQHVSIDEIGETSTSPLPDAPDFSISEDQLAIGISHALGGSITAGTSVRYDRSNETGIAESSTSLGAGFLFAHPASIAPLVGASIRTFDGGVRYAAGLEVAPGLGQQIGLRAGYGLRGGENLPAEHRIGMSVDWKRLVSITGGLVTANPGAERSWEPVMGASLKLSRYELGVLREALASDFGAAYSFRFRLGLQ